jgi:hypothetical protein
MTTSRDRLGELRERARDARQRRATAQKALDAAERVGDDQAVVAVRGQLAVIQSEIERVTALESNALSQIAGVTTDAYTFGDNWLDDPETIRDLQALAHTTRPVGSMNLGQIMSADEFVNVIQTGAWHSPKWGNPAPRVGSTGGGDVGVTPFVVNSTPGLPDTARYGPFQGVIPQLRRRIRLLDLIGVSTMTSGNFFFIAIESGSLDTAAETAELQLKPGADDNLASQMISIQTIAHWLKIARQQLDDVPGFGVTVNERLIYGVTRRIEQAILNGNGTGNNILGILNQTGLQTVAFTAGAVFTDLILQGITAILNVEAEPDAIVCNPSDAEQMLIAKTSGSGQRLDSVGAFVTPPDQLWGLPLITSTVIPAGQVLVGTFGREALLYVREGPSLRTSDADQDDFLRNRLTMLAEARVGLAVFHPAAFCLVHTA